MGKVAIVSDSTCSLPPELFKKHNIGIAPCFVTLDGKAYLDNVELTLHEYMRMEPGIKTRTTTGGSLRGYYEAFAKASQTTDSILCIPLSKALSASYTTAMSARDMILDEQPNLKIEVVDSKNCIGGLGLMALEAARASESGKSLAECRRIVEELVPRTKYSCTLESISFFIKLGRAPVGSDKDEKDGYKCIQGIVRDPGLPEFIGKELGIDATLDKMVDLVAKYVDTSNPVHAVISYSHYVKWADRVVERLKSQYNVTELYVTQCTPVMVAAMGPVIFLCYWA